VRWHGLAGRLTRIVDSGAFFDALTIDCTAIDIHASRGGERIVDLNGALPADLIGAFDFALDPGALEHCFNIGAAIANVARAVAVGGYVCHFSPMSMFNHGFYDLNPTFFHDVYTQNGFEIALLKRCVGDPLSSKTFEIPATARFADPPSDASLVVIAKRMRAGEPIWPMQSKYLANSNQNVPNGIVGGSSKSVIIFLIIRNKASLSDIGEISMKRLLGLAVASMPRPIRGVHAGV
jgi:hypothetical protein